MGQALLPCAFHGQLCLCAEVPLSLLGVDQLFSDETFPSQGVVLSPSFLPCPSYPKAGSNHRVAMSVVDRQAALGTRRQLWQYTAPPQLLWCGCVSQEVSVSGTDGVKVRRRQAVWGAWLCSQQHGCPRVCPRRQV